jgi:hypothetical protein
MLVARALMKLGPRTAVFSIKAQVAFLPGTAALLRLLCPDVSKTAAYIAAPASSCANRRRLAPFPLQRIACAAWRVAPLLDGAMSFICSTLHLLSTAQPWIACATPPCHTCSQTATPPYARHARLATL